MRLTDAQLRLMAYRPAAHQLAGVDWLTEPQDEALGRTYPRAWFLQDQVGVGKTKQVIDAVNVLYENGVIDRVFVLAPPVNRSATWYDLDMGEIARHAWSGVPIAVRELHQRDRRWSLHSEELRDGCEPLRWFITNYEFIRSDARLKEVLPLVDDRTLLVCDESLEVSNHRAAQFLSALALRRKAWGVALLNGTPGDPADLFAQCCLLAPVQGRAIGSAILQCPSFTHFKAEYAVIGGFDGRRVVGWRGLEKLQALLKPYVLRRLMKDCHDMPAALPPVALSVALDDREWRVYTDMRDDLVAWLGDQPDTVAIAAHAAVRAMRLAQVTCGFIGGVVDVEADDQLSLLDGPAEDFGDRPDWLPAAGLPDARTGAVDRPVTGTETRDGGGWDPSALTDALRSLKPTPEERLTKWAANPLPGQRPAWAPTVRPSVAPQQLVIDVASKPITRIENVGTSKLDALITWIEQGMRDDPDFKAMICYAFRHQLERDRDAIVSAVVDGRLRGLRVAEIRGGQTKDERAAGVANLDPYACKPGPAVTLLTSAGSRGINQAGCHRVLFVSNDRRPSRREQMEGRPARPPQKLPVWYGDMVATGPKGQKTIDHVVVKALRNNIDLQTWTCAAWVTAIQEE